MEEIKTKDVIKLLEKDFKLDNEKLEKFKTYYEFLVEENQKYNLTNITNIDEVYIKHFYDSMLVYKYHDLHNVKMCDIGSGAGFPSIPLKILDDSIELTIIEPTLKRCNFLKMLCEKLNLNVTILNERSENIANSYRECFDVVTARAVANTSVLLELCVSYCKVGGVFLALKGANYKEELSSAKNAMTILNVNYFDIEYHLPYDMGLRAIIKFNKMKKTNLKYPRRYAQIKQKPL